MERVSLATLRRFVVAHQRFASRARRARAGELAQTVRNLGAVQLDSISTVDRAHRLTLATRVGAFDPEAVSALLADGVIFEYWGHEACLLGIEDYPLMRHRMHALADRHWWGRERTAAGRQVEREVLARIRDEGALPARAFEGRSEGMWGWKPAKRALEHLFAAGEVAVAGRRGFQRLYDLPERVIPAWALSASVPDEAAFRRGYALRAVQGRGALTEAGIAEHCRLPGGARAIAPHVDELVAAGLLRRVAVDDGGANVVVCADAALDGDPAPPVLVCPFDNLMWDRAFLRRLFGFDHLIEVYKRPHERLYGYYVLPLLAGDRILGRADLKVDRARGLLQVCRFSPQPRAGRAVELRLERAAMRLAHALGLEGVER